MSRSILTFAILSVLVLLAAAARLFFIGGAASWGDELFNIRLTRLFAAAIVGSSLATGGVFLQSLMRNSLASPDLLGLASGSGLAVLAAVYVGYAAAGGVVSSGLSLPVASIAAVLGALGALAVTYLLSQRRGLIDPILLVLTGVAVGILCSAGTMLIRHMLPFQQSGVADRMMLGALRDDVGTVELLVLGAITLAGIVMGVAAGRAMDVAALSDDEAVSIGVSLGKLRTLLFIASGVLTAVSIILAGPIGFVGLVCPHVARLAAGPTHRWLVVLAAMTGALLVIGSDTIVRAIDFPSGRMPISVVTALVGGPVFVLMLRRRGGWSGGER